jgi:hypothetical protein
MKEPFLSETTVHLEGAGGCTWTDVSLTAVF